MNEALGQGGRRPTKKKFIIKRITKEKKEKSPKEIKTIKMKKNKTNQQQKTQTSGNLSLTRPWLRERESE